MLTYQDRVALCGLNRWEVEVGLAACNGCG